MRDEHITVIMPKYVKKYPGRGFDTIMYEKNIKANHATTERNTIMRMRIVAFALIMDVIDKQQFLDLLRAGDEDAVIAYLAAQLKLEDIHFKFADAWRAIDFKFGRS
jgi:hypothetical protein